MTDTIPHRDGPTNGGSSASTLSYLDVFAAAQPQATLPVLQARFSNAGRLHKDLVDYFAARKDLEEQYLKNLAKLVTKRPLFEAADSPSAVAAGGVYATPSIQPILDALLKELQTTAAIHTELEDRISKQIETPLRGLPVTHNDWSHIRELEDSLAAQVKDISSLDSQLDKDRKKLASTPSSNIKKHSQATNKLNDSQQQYDRSLAIWATEAPFTFEAYQRIDKARLDAIVEAVIQFETAQADAAQRLMKLSEQTTSIALGFEPGAEIQYFLRRAQESMPKADSMQSASAAPLTAEFGTNGHSLPTSASLAGAAASTASLPSISNAPGAAGDTSVSTTHSRRPPPPPGSSSGGSTLLGALSRFGGRKARDSQVVSSRKNADTNTIYGALSEDEPGQNLGVRTSGANRTPSIFRSSRTSVDRTSERPRTAQSGLPSTSTDVERGNSSSLMAPLVPTRAVPKSSSASLSSLSAAGTAPPVDAEGFSIPPPDRKPWDTAPDSSSRPNNGTEELLDDDEAPALPSRVNALSIAASASKPHPVSDSDRDREALERMRSTLGAPLGTSTDGVSRRSTTGRRERRTTRGFTQTPGLTGGVPEEGSPPSQFTAPMAGLGGPAEGRTVSMLSTTSGFGLGSGPGASALSIASKAQTQGPSVNALTANPFETTNLAASTPSSGVVRASITEAVNAVFMGSNLVRVQVVGEVQVLLSGGGGSGKLKLSLDGGSALDRVVPNPTFLAPGAADHTYVLDAAALLASSAGSESEARATVLKYQLDLPQQSVEVVPVDVHAQWRCEPTQTSLMISYRPNASSRLLTQASSAAAFDDFEIIAPVSPPGSVSAVMTKPTGRWDAEESKLLWSLADSKKGNQVALTPGADAGKLLARLQVDKPSVPQPVNVRWSIKGRTISELGLRIAPADGSEGSAPWSFDPAEVVRLTVSGKFLAA